MQTHLIRSAAVLLFAVVLSNCNRDKNTNHQEGMNNPILQKWTGPYNGVPPFDKIKTSDFKSALEAGMTENRDEIKGIVANTEAATFKNTIEALERTGFALRRAVSIYGIWKSNLGSPEMDSIQEVMEPRLTTFYDSIIQNTELFKRIETVF